MKAVIPLLLTLAAGSSFGAVSHPKIFKADLIEPGKTQGSDLKKLMGRPMRMLRDGTREYYFYDLDSGSAMDATVSVKKGVVEYVSYLCGPTMKEVNAEFKGLTSTTHVVRTSGPGYSGSAQQILYPERGRGFLVEHKSRKVKACMAWEPGRKFEELGR
jgi:hypothetical protein